MANSEAEQLSSFSDSDSPLERWVAKFAKVLLYIGMCAVIIMMLLTVIHAISRYLFNHPLLGTVSISSILLAMTIFAVGGYTQVVKGHIIVGILVDRLSKRNRAIVDSFSYVICLIVITLAFWQSVLQTFILMNQGTQISTLFLPQFAFFFMVALGWGVFSLVIALHLRHTFATALGRTRN